MIAEIQELERQIETKRFETIESEIDCLNDLGWAINRENPKKSIDLSQSAFTLAKKHEYPKGKADAYRNLGASNSWLSEYKIAIDYSVRAKKLYEELGDVSNGARVLYNIATTHYFLTNFQIAFELYEGSYYDYSSVKNQSGTANALNGLGTVSYAQGDNKRAIQYLLKAQIIAEEVGDLEVLIKVLGGLASSYNNLEQHSKTIPFLDKAMLILEKIGGISHKANLCLEFGKSYTGLEQYTESIAHYEKAVKYYTQVGQDKGACQSMILMANVYLEIGDYKKAKDISRKAIELASIKLLLEEICEYHKIMQVIAELGGNLAERNEHFELYIEFKEKWFEAKLEEKAKGAEIKFQIEKERSNRKDEALVETSGHLKKAYEDSTILSDIGAQITALLKVEDIIETVYAQINRLMDATIFSISFFDEKNNRLVLPGTIERGKKFPVAFLEIKEKHQLSVMCFNESKEILINDFTKYNKKHHKEAVFGELPESLIYLPLIHNKHTRGTISVQSFKKNAYAEHHLDTLRSLAIYVAIAVENARQYERTEDKVAVRTAELILQKEEVEKAHQNIQLISEIGKKIIATLDIAEIIEKIYDNVNTLMDAEAFGVGIYDQEKEALYFAGFIEKGKILEDSYLPLSDDTPSSRCFLTGELLQITGELEAVTGEAPKSIIYLPLISNNNKIGVITVQSFVENAYSETHVQILETLAVYAAIALENAQSYWELNKLNDKLEKLSIVASETDNSILITDADGNIEWANAAFTEQTGYTIEEIIEEVGSNIRDLSSTENFIDYLDQVYAKKKSVAYEHIYFNKSGKEMWVQTTLTPILDKKGEITKLVAIDADIHERKEAELKVQEKNKDITDSINYASRIQLAMLPPLESITGIYPESFVLYRPKDIVSGDFYWTANTENNELIVATVDCTGHGVPGAFLTIVGNSILNQIVNFDKITSPAKIIEQMNHLILDRFQSNADRTIKDGMDISICKIEKKEKNYVIQFAGAYNSLYILQNNEVIEVKGSRYAIGTPLSYNPKFDEHSIEMNEGEMLYLTSDGYADQLGGLRGKKFMKRKFKEFLQSIHKKPVVKQHEELTSNIDAWRGSIKQTDDILIIGIKL